MPSTMPGTDWYTFFWHLVAITYTWQTLLKCHGTSPAYFHSKNRTWKEKQLMKSKNVYDSKKMKKNNRSMELVITKNNSFFLKVYWIYKWNNPPFILELPIINLRDIKMRIWRRSANSIELGQTARMCRLAWLYTGGKG